MYICMCVCVCVCKGIHICESIYVYIGIHIVSFRWAPHNCKQSRKKNKKRTLHSPLLLLLLRRRRRRLLVPSVSVWVKRGMEREMKRERNMISWRMGVFSLCWSTRALVLRFYCAGPAVIESSFADIPGSFAEIQGAIVGVAMNVKNCYCMAV